MTGIEPGSWSGGRAGGGGEPGVPTGSREGLPPGTGLVTATTVGDLLNDAPRSRFHRRAVVISGMGFFTDAYDLFVISTVAVLVKTQWHLSTTQTSWVTGSAILGAFVGAFVFGRIADLVGRKSVYATVAVIMIVGALASAFAPASCGWSSRRFVLGARDRRGLPGVGRVDERVLESPGPGRLVGLVFSMQAVGLIVGPLVGLVLLSSGISHDLDVAAHARAGRASPRPQSSTCGRRCPSRPGSKRRSRATTDQAAAELARVL